MTGICIQRHNVDKLRFLTSANVLLMSVLLVYRFLFFLNVLQLQECDASQEGVQMDAFCIFV